MKLHHPEEVLTSVSGWYGAAGASVVVIRSLTFESNRSKYGPFGTEQGTPFALPVVSSGGEVVGFHGRSAGACLHSIGCHLSSRESAGKVWRNAPPSSALWSITRSYDSNGHRYADSYDNVLTASSLPKEPPSQMSKVYPVPLDVQFFFSAGHS